MLPLEADICVTHGFSVMQCGVSRAPQYPFTDAPINSPNGLSGSSLDLDGLFRWLAADDLSRLTRG